MNLARNSETQRDVDLQRTRQTFLFARELLAANSCAWPHGAVRDMCHWAPAGELRTQPATDATDSPTH